MSLEVDLIFLSRENWKLFNKEYFMKSKDIYNADENVDIISGYQELVIWRFDFEKLQEVYQGSTYSFPVLKKLLAALKMISLSKNEAIRERQFTIFAGDFGSSFEYYGIGIGSRVFSLK
jgi:hypothetical protein